jgi:AcrR family transcriptional regulator
MMSNTAGFEPEQAGTLQACDPSTERPPANGPTMAKKKLHPSAALMLQIENAFFAHGYSKLTMERLAQSCNFSRRALYFYFSSKAEAFRGTVRFRNDLGLSAGFAAGRKRWSEGGNALQILTEIINIRYGDTRRLSNASPHLVELNAEVFTRCNDIVKDVAIFFEAELAKLIVELQAAGVVRLRPEVTAEQLAQALANGARGVNQRIPTVAPEDLASRYSEMCRFILYGCAEVPAASPRSKGKDSAPKKIPPRKTERERA